MFTITKKAFYLSIATLVLLSCGSNNGGTDYSVYPVKIGGKWGYVSTKGEYIVNPSLNAADHFSDGLARVELQGKVGYINQKGKFVIPCEYLGGTSFKNGKAFVTSPEMYPACINKKGKKLFQVDSVEYVRTFSEGFAMIVTSARLYGFINEKGKKVVPPQYASAHEFSEGLAAVKSGDKWGFINSKGDIVIEPQYTAVGDFKEGLAFVQVNGQYGYIDRKGQMIINPQFDKAANFSEGLASVMTGGSYGFINKKGNYAINPQFGNAEPFSGGLALFQQGYYGFINSNGKIVINPTYIIATSFIGDFAFVYDAQVAGKLGTIDKKGKTAIVPQFDDVALPKNNVIETRSNYYESSAYLAKMFEDWNSTSFYGLDANSTLEKTRKNFPPEKGPADSTYSFKFKKPEMVEGVALTHGILGFDQSTYKLVDNYVSSWLFGTYKSGKKRQYINTCRLKAAEFNYELKGVANNKEASFAHGIADELSTRLGEHYSKQGESYVFELSDLHPGYTISFANGGVKVLVLYAK